MSAFVNDSALTQLTITGRTSPVRRRPSTDGDDDDGNDSDDGDDNDGGMVGTNWFREHGVQIAVWLHKHLGELCLPLVLISINLQFG